MKNLLNKLGSLLPDKVVAALPCALLIGGSFLGGMIAGGIINALI